MKFYYCEECGEVVSGESVYVETRVAREYSWGCGVSECDACYEDRETPLVFCLTCDSELAPVNDEELDLSIVDYLGTK